VKPSSDEAPTRLLSTVAAGIERICPRSLERAVPFVLVIVAASYTIVFVACASTRLTFGFELSWLESGMQAMTDRLAAHQSIYAEPSPAYVPFIYPPLYYVVAHGIDLALPWLGQFTPMRLVSLLATVATALTVYITLGRRTPLGLGRSVLLATLLFAFYGRLEFWHDTSRVDGLFAFFLFAATALLIEGRGKATAFAAGCLGGMAILTKQSAVPLLVGAAVPVALIARRRALLVLLFAAASSCAGLAMLGELDNPWLYYYLLRVPSTHVIQLGTFGSSLIFVLCTMPFFLLAAVSELRGRARHGAAPWSLPRWQSTLHCWSLTFAIWLIVIFLLRLKDGASLNYFHPLVPVGIIVAAGACERLGARCQPLLLVQFLILLYNPLPAIPTADDWRAGFDLLGTLRRIPGDVYLPQFPAYLSRLRKSPVAHGVAVCDLAAIRPDIVLTINKQIEEGHYTGAIPWGLAGEHAPCRPNQLGRRFRLLDEFPQGGPFFTRTHASRVAGIYLFDTNSIAAAGP
jgi:hypothetical protein